MNRVHRTSLQIGVLITAVVLLSGCSTDAPFKRGFDYAGGGLTGPDFDNVTFSGTVRPVLQRCVSCHAAGAGGWAYDGGASSHGAVLAVINRSNAPNSLLLVKATGGDGHGGGSIFSAASNDYAAIVAWIEAGAPDN